MASSIRGVCLLKLLCRWSPTPESSNRIHSWRVGILNAFFLETRWDIHVLMFWAATIDKFDKIFAVNVRGTYLCFRYAAEQMIKQGRGGRLLGASSVVGLTGEAFVSLYGATKWAIRGLVVSLGEAEIIFSVLCTSV